MERLVSHMHKTLGARGAFVVEPLEFAELSRRVDALRRMGSCFSHVCLSGFTEESDGRRVVRDAPRRALTAASR